MSKIGTRPVTRATEVGEAPKAEALPELAEKVVRAVMGDGGPRSCPDSKPKSVGRERWK